MQGSPNRRLLCVGLIVALAPWLLGTDPAPRRDIIGTEKKRYSQHNEELIIRDFFQDRRDGFFLDVGCAWPVYHNTTYYLEKHLGWSGIAVDAVPDYGPSWKTERPHSRFFNYLVTDHSGGPEAFYRAKQRGVSSTQKDRYLGKRKVHSEEIKVPAITLNDLLAQNGATRIDLLSMDIEGSEPAALAGFDIERFRPQLVVIEANFQKRDLLRHYFENHEYELIERYLKHDSINWYFEPRNQDPSRSWRKP